MPSDGSAPARNIGSTFPAANELQLAKGLSVTPDGTRVQVYQAEGPGALSIDPVTGKSEALPWTTDLPDFQRTIC